MQIFLSHSSHQKPLVREIRKSLPEHLGSWIDEEKLLIGDQLGASIQSAIKTDSDYVLLFIDEHAAASAWVVRELEWALQAEKESERTILLPILIDEGSLHGFDNVEIQNRKYLRLKDYLEGSVRSLAEAITAELFALVCRDVQRLRNPKPKQTGATITEADALVQGHAATIRKAVFPHRRENPIPRDKLLEIVSLQVEQPIREDEFELIMTLAVQRNLIPGLSYDGFEAYLVEEHSRWKFEVEHEKKEKVGRRAAALIQNGMSVFLDAGSTTEEVVRVLCTKIEKRALTRITVATTSVNIADMISDCCVKMGFDDEFSAVRLYIPGGQIRPSTQAIVPAFASEYSQVLRLSEAVGGFDLGMVGVNGVDLVGGFTTHANAEAANKKDILQVCRSSIIVGDSSKVGLRLEAKFADFADDLRLVIDGDPENDALLTLAEMHGDKLILV